MLPGQIPQIAKAVIAEDPFELFMASPIYFPDSEKFAVNVAEEFSSDLVVSFTLPEDMLSSSLTFVTRIAVCLLN